MVLDVAYSFLKDIVKPIYGYFKAKPELEINDVKRRIVEGDLRITFDVFNKGKATAINPRIHGIATDKNSKVIEPIANHTCPSIPSKARDEVELNFKHFNENYEKITISVIVDDEEKTEHFKVSEIPET